MRAYTAEEVREKMLAHIRGIVDYWVQDHEESRTVADGVAFSILSLLDGSTLTMPSVDLVIRPHLEDREFHEELGENWFEDGLVINEDILLHEFYFNSI